MKKSDLVNEVAKTTLTKAEAARGMEIFLDDIKKALKKRDEVYISGLELSVLSKEKQEQGEIQRLVRQSR
jgi:nucleoid DNA-binding protein